MADLAAFFRAQAEASAHVQFVYDVSAGQVIFVNAAYEQVLQGTCSQVNAELPTLLSRLHEDDRSYLAHCWGLLVQGRLTDEIEVRLERPGHSDQWFCLNTHYEQLADGTVLVGGTLRDNSTMKEYQVNADRFNARKNTTLEILSHDMSAAFIMIEQIVDYLHHELPTPANSKTSEMLQVLSNTSQSSVKMIRDFINIEFLASANTPLKADRVEVSAMLHDSLNDLQRSKELMGQYFSYSLPTEPLYAWLDVNKFTQVLINLISNALKFTPDGKRVMVQIEAYHASVQFHIIDEGIGIPDAMQPHLFEPFTKARRPGLRGEPTTGLGLALCKTIVEWHGGSISVKSTEGEGSIFTVEVPQAEFC